MIKTIFTHVLVAYLAVGMAGASAIAFSTSPSYATLTYYVLTWPTYIYCTTEHDDTDAIMDRFDCVQQWMFKFN